MNAEISISKNQTIAPIDKRIFSSFIEHMGRAVYTGIYEPGHTTADKYGFRTDVASLIRPLNLSHIRYPGGNFLSGYNWLDGIGPKEERPMRADLAWSALEPNEVGTDEFLQWCERLGIEPMLGVNLGTGTPQSAVDLLEYVNGDLPTKFANLRRQNGHEKPYNIKLWCLGNEMDGPWQICMKTAEEYGRIACETAKMMKWMDPSIELIACGSSFYDMPTFGSWERTVLKHCYRYIDYISLHQYYQNNDGDIPSFLSRSLEMEEMIHKIAVICREAKMEQKEAHDIALSFDEWNVWYHFQKSGQQPPKWTVARPIEEENYDLADALLVGCMLNTLLRNADTVKIACLAQLVNVIAPIMTEPNGRAWVQTIYYPFFYVSNYGRGTSLRLSCESAQYDCTIRKNVPYLDASAVLNHDGICTLFLVNRNQTEALNCTIYFNQDWNYVQEWISLSGNDSAQRNDADHEPIKPQARECPNTKDGILTIDLPAFSWNMIRLSVNNR